MTPTSSSTDRPVPAPPPGAPVRVPGTGAQALVRALEALAVDTVFGVRGAAVQLIFDAIGESRRVRCVQVRHEQAAGHAAEGYAAATGRVGVCLAGSGPGATNLVTAIADAQMDSVPLVAITGQVPSGSIGTDAYQEVDTRGITMPVTKHSYLVTDPAEIARTVAEAFHLAGTGRPGPVLVDVAKDALRAPAEFRWPQTLDLPGYRPAPAPHRKKVREAAELLLEARRPVLYVGGGVITAKASEELAALVGLTGAPVVTTLKARGAYPDTAPENLGMPGAYGSVPAVLALQQADLVVALGARFDDRVTGRPATFAPAAKIVHADVDPAEISKNRRADVPIVGDCKEVLADLVSVLGAELGSAGDRRPDRAAWWASIDGWRETYPVGYPDPADGTLGAPEAIRRLGELVGPDAIFVGGVGRHQMWAARLVAYEHPGTWISSGGLGTMGFAVPAALGARVGRPDRAVWAIDGDASFQRTSQELATCALEGVPIKVALVDDASGTGLVPARTPAPRPRASTAPSPRRVPDFVALAEAYGCVGLRCDRPADLDTTIEQAMAIDDVPVVVDLVVRDEATRWPMVAPGTSLHDVQIARASAPEWGEGA